MRTLATGLQAHLDTGATTLCWCWKLAPLSASPLGFTDHDRDLSFDGISFEAVSGFAGTEIETSLGLNVDDLEAEGALVSNKLIEADLFAGVYDNAEVEIWLVNWQDVAQRQLLRKGNLGEVSRGQTGFKAEIRGLAHQLNQPQGRLFQYGCDAVLGDQRCGVDLNGPAFRGTAIVASSEDDRRLHVTGIESFAAGWFARGKASWNSGLNVGRSMDVKAHRIGGTGIVIELWEPMAETVSPGDAFDVTAGCDKQFATCRDKFANAMQFRGFPQMPGNDFVTAYPNRDDTTNDGASRSQ